MSRPFVSPALEARREQMFPTLTASEIDAVRRFSVERRYASAERVFETGKPTPGLLVVISGGIRITGRDGHGHDIPVVEHREGQFAGEIGQLTGARSFVDGLAVGDLHVRLVEPEPLRHLLIAEAALGEKILRALTLRRVGLIESGAGGPVLVGSRRLPGVLRLRSFLGRNGVPHTLVDPDDGVECARSLIAARTAEELPLVLCPDGSVLHNPTEAELARCIGMLDGPKGLSYDIAIVGAGPAGLSTAVYAASEGLSVVVLDTRAFGGQAGASARIENYLGFPTGISGQALTARAYTQALKFGTRMMIPANVDRLVCDTGTNGDRFALEIAGGERIGCRTVVIASGARYRRPDNPDLRAREGRGAWYWASPIEAAMCAGQEVALVGGGNSAGQAAVFLAAHVKKVWLLIRGSGLAASMSAYMVERIGATANIEVSTGTEIVGLSAGSGDTIDSVTWRNRDTGVDVTRPVQNIFLFLGADPETGWLADCGVALDDKGFVRTGAAAAASDGSRSPLESSKRGIFAVGDVRSGSVKRVGGAIGEGAAAVAQIWAYLES